MIKNTNEHGKKWGNNTLGLGRFFGGLNIIQLNESRTKNLDLRKFVIYHEIAHYKDQEINKRKLPAIAGLLSCFASGLTSLIYHRVPKIVTLPYWFKISSFLRANFLSLSGITFGVYKYSDLQKEHRANILACKELLKKQQVKPIAAMLCNIHADILNQIEFSDRCPRKDEYRVMRKFMESNHYSIKTFHQNQSSGKFQMYKSEQLLLDWTWEAIERYK